MAERDRVDVSKGKVKVEVRPHEGTGEIPKVSGDDMLLAGWTDDPGQGKAILTSDGREVLNPVPMAPPVGYVEQPTLMEMLEQMVHRHLSGLKGDDEIDTVQEMDDFEIDEDPDPMSVYEIVDMVPEAPALPREAAPEPKPVEEPVAPVVQS